MPPGGTAPSNLHRVPIADVVDGHANLVEVDSAMAEQRAVLLHVELANLPLPAEPADFRPEVVAALGRVRYIVETTRRGQSRVSPHF
ncbi:MAG: hypothetical protein L0Z50_37520 [Verrucomicrobiales bacterium]|nr:hypothetical protein [Verrucomicrobiales bacterium]